MSAENFSHYNQKITVAGQDISGLEISLNDTVMEIIDVHATPLHSSTIESALPVNVLSADELRLKQASTLGETLKNEVGVHSSYYGPVSSSPIIRGLDGPRVLISQNGLDVGMLLVLAEIMLFQAKRALRHKLKCFVAQRLCFMAVAQ